MFDTETLAMVVSDSQKIGHRQAERPSTNAPPVSGCRDVFCEVSLILAP
jgi:hypothetical protein